MIFLIIAVNLSITLLNIYIAIRIWQLRQLIARIATILISYEGYFNTVLRVAPKVLDRGQNNIYLARRRYQILQLQVAKIKQLIWLFIQSYRILRGT
jgi:hypothetical protein